MRRTGFRSRLRGLETDSFLGRFPSKFTLSIRPSQTSRVAFVGRFDAIHAPSVFQVLLRCSVSQYRRSTGRRGEQGINGRFSCRVWIESNESPVAYQVKCQISTSDHLNIIEMHRSGTVPKTRWLDRPATDDRMVQSFALIYFRSRTSRDV